MSPARGVLLRALATFLAVTALLLGAAPAAQAHDFLVGTSPEDGSIVAVVPARVTLTFNQPALAIGTAIIVTGPTGQVQAGKPVLVDNTITEHLRPASPAGRYKVVWRVTARDGHPASGTFSFTATKASPGKRATATTPAISASATPTFSGPSTPATSIPSTPAGENRHGTLWRVLAAGIPLVLLLVAFIVLRARRNTPRNKRLPD